MNSNFFIILLFASLLLMAGWFFVNVSPQAERPLPSQPVTTFEECAASGAPVTESYPRTCREGNGNVFTENIGNVLEKTDRIRLTTPIPNQVITSPLEVKGEARGNWFFEASFPVTLVDGDGNEVAHGIATAESEWMTTEFVPFRAMLNFSRPITKSGTLRLERDNPSGLPENADALTIPVRFTL